LVGSGADEIIDLARKTPDNFACVIDLRLLYQSTIDSFSICR